MASDTAAGIDVDALEKKYAEERAKRLRPDATNQYVEFKGKFAALAEDPHARRDFTRSAITEDTDVLIIGAGFGGLLAGAHLRQNGVKNIRIVEKGADVGGTWYWNRYPGAACDVESYIYMPLLEEVGYMPTEKYAKAPEIFGYCQRLAQHFDLYGGALFQTEVRFVAWDPIRSRWIVKTDREDVIEARFVVSATGWLFKPKLPGIPGIDSFEGHAFHTSRWDYGYTGGDHLGNLTGLSDKTVGIIGTGSTGIQTIPVLGQWAKHLYVFQRTPSSIDPRGNRPTDTQWAKSLKPGWQKDRMDNFSAVTLGGSANVDLVNDGWTAIIRDTAAPIGDSDAMNSDEIKRRQFARMEQTRQKIARIVKDPATAEALKPYYSYFCKRPCFHDEYLETFNRPNVTMVDTGGRGVERITAKGVVVGGREYPLDCLIFATGFDFMVEYGRNSGVEVVGPGGVRLSDHWADGARTLWGAQTHGFPNFLLVSPIQAGVTFNYMDIADEVSRHVAFVIAESLKRGIREIQPTKEIEEDWVHQVVETGKPRRAFLEACTPGYYNFEGQRKKSVELNDFYCGSGMEYLSRLREWRKKGTLENMEIRKEP
jgi:cation diffusion facilitator CzcD-associated flavoprotein CzcO